MTHAAPERTIPVVTEKEKSEVITIVDPLLTHHESYLSEFPAEGVDYFKLPKAPDILTDAHSALSDQEIEEIVHCWVYDDLETKLSGKYNTRAIGSWLSTFSLENAFRIQDVLDHMSVSESDPELMPKLTQFAKLTTILQMYPGEKGPQEGQKAVIKNNRDHLYEMLKYSRNTFELAYEANIRAGISLFGRGFLPSSLGQLFNHSRVDILLNEFDEGQISALETALNAPDIIDGLSSASETTLKLRIALTGAQVRSGQDQHLALMEYADTPEAGSKAYLHYFFVSEREDAITDPQLKEILASPLKRSFINYMLIFLINSGKRIEPDSYFNEQLQQADLSASDIVSIVRYGLDANDGNYNAIDPEIRKQCEIVRQGSIEQEAAGQLVLACTSFGIPLPQVVEPYLAYEGKYGFANIAAESRRAGNKLGHLLSYPESAIYKIMSQGFDALPYQVRPFFENQETQQQTDTLVKGILRKLFTNGYFYHYFGAMIPSENYPEPVINVKDVFREFWKIVHPDIWQLISKARRRVIADFILSGLKDKKVHIEIHHENGMRGFRDTPIAECLPPDMYEQVTGLPVDQKSLRSRLVLTAQRIPDQAQIAKEGRIDTTDYIRNILLPRAAKKEIDVLTQIRLIHRTHMRGKEHIVLSRGQAQRLLESPEIETVDRLGGIIRSPQQIPMTISLAGGLVLCASYQNTPQLMVQLSEVAEALFPVGAINQHVNSKNIHHIVSAFQLALALIHPFYEVNGRTSEDAMHILWNRRPDLAGTVRHISSKGDRGGKDVDKRMDIINIIGLKIVRDIARELGVGRVESFAITDYQDMISLLKNKYKRNPNEVEKEYLKMYDGKMTQIIEEFRNVEELIYNPNIIVLARHLRGCSKTYTSKTE